MGHSLFSEHSFKCSKCVTSQIIPLAPFYKRNTEAQESKLFPLTYVIVVDPRHELREFGSEVFSCNHNVILPTGDVSNKDFPAPKKLFSKLNDWLHLGCWIHNKYLHDIGMSAEICGSRRAKYPHILSHSTHHLGLFTPLEIDFKRR